MTRRNTNPVYLTLPHLLTLNVVTLLK